jgi:beta-glucanase (GH16 family)
VTGYEVFRGSTAIGTTAAATRSFTDTGLAASTPYTYQVRARDAAGNWSAKSGSLNVSTASSGAGSLSPPHSANVPAGYRLVWNDEFSGSGLPDSSKWIYDDWGNVNGWGNQELQYYGVADLDNTQLSNGKLFITARKETVVSGTGHVFNYTSARLTTYGKADWNYGYFEVRAKMPCGAGTWPAIWTLGSTGWWPAGGEIDILEHFQGTHTLAAANVHWEENGTHREVSPQYRDVSTICSDFHNYWLKWTADAIVIGVDGDTMLSVSKQAIAEGRWPFDNRQFLLLNLAVGGFGGGPVDDSIFPRSMVVDYVRVYQTP